MPSIFDFVAYVKCFHSLLFLGLLTASTVLAITGKFFASIAFALIYMVTSEIFPTNARYLMVLLYQRIERSGMVSLLPKLLANLPKNNSMQYHQCFSVQ